MDQLKQKDLEIQRLRKALIKQTSRTRIFQDMLLEKAAELYRAYSRIFDSEHSENCIFCQKKTFGPVENGNQLDPMCRLCSLESGYENFEALKYKMKYCK